MFKKVVFKNGLRLITVPGKSARSVTILVLVKTGSKYEKKEINGISHFLEHLYFKGTKKRPSPIAVAETLDRVGGIYNAFTGEDYTGYWVKVSSSNFDLALDWVSDIFFNSLLPKEEIEKERGVILEEINTYLDIPSLHIHDLWTELLYGDQPAGRPITGRRENILKMSRQELIGYRENQYVAQNTLVSVAGNINPVKVLKGVKKYFQKIKTKTSLKKEVVTENQTKPQLLLKFKETDQTHLSLGVRGYNTFNPKKYTQELLASILGGMMSSRLFIEIRGKLGLAYSINTSTEDNPDAGYLVTGAGVDNKRIDVAISAILKEYKKISQKKVSKEELRKAKDHYKGTSVLYLEQSEAKASFFARQELLENKILTPEEVFDKIDKITSEDILLTARDIFKPEKLNLALIGPFKDKNKFQKLLKI
jgi:predicted Zn-dependent peptidase